MYYTYILECSDGSLYVGHTDDLPARITAHNAGLGPAFTACRRPVRLAYSEAHRTRDAAIARERQLKRWSAQKKRALITRNASALRSLSRSHDHMNSPRVTPAAQPPRDA
jgi:tRNA/rRNA methyltransferase